MPISMRKFKVVPNTFVRKTLLYMYVKFGSLADARKVFDEMPERDVYSWTAMIAGYSRHGIAYEALALFRRMRETSVSPNHFTFASVLSVCAKLAALEEGIEIHEEINRRALNSDVCLGNCIIDMYAKCGSVQKARNVFDKMPQLDVVSWNTMIAGYASNGFVFDALKLFLKMPEPDLISWNTMIAGFAQNGFLDEAVDLFEKMPKPNVVSWNTMIAGYVQSGRGEDALKLFHRMQLAGEEPNLKTFASLFQACAASRALEEGMAIHGQVIQSRLKLDEFVESALIDMYAKCGRIEKARALFDKMAQRSSVSWNTLIAGYVQSESMDEALELFGEMPQPDVVSWTTLIGGYMQNSQVDEALKLFKEMPERDTTTWTAMIAGYVLNGKSVEALSLFQQMQYAGVKLGLQTYTNILPACASLAALEQGIEIHEEIVRRGFHSNVVVANALLDMYSKCGSIERAQQIFDNMIQKNVISWTAMIAGYGMHGRCKEGLDLFEKMHRSGVKPDDVTLVCILSACCHGGLVDEGLKYFDCMTKFYHITPVIEHYVCMVDLLGRAGRIDEAHDFINKMPIKPDATLWRCFLGACRMHNNIELGEYAAQRLAELDPQNAAPYVLLSNIYASVGRWDDTKNVRKIMKNRIIKKMPGCSWIEINKKMHTFLAEDIS
ncbi:pentatricopeptide repeat-containing protein At4g02750 [Cryptomeria japonica]|uniref:pentatricopeptide repeat-containing protein At4g02750 n=1 Tax=Cryptomeria japonica TaxID=3369 RepID=UPI0027DA531F|nr:pentatricopeptide repeat-containing protein At4g02750 [Cryptomeria japonica]